MEHSSSRNQSPSLDVRSDNLSLATIGEQEKSSRILKHGFRLINETKNKKSDKYILENHWESGSYQKLPSRTLNST